MKIKTIEIEIPAGCEIAEAKRGAITKSLLHSCNVTFDFNSNSYSVDHQDLYKQVKHKK